MIEYYNNRINEIHITYVISKIFTMVKSLVQTYQEIRVSSQPFNFIQDWFLLALGFGSFFILVPLLKVAFQQKWSSHKIDMKLSILMVVFDVLTAADAILVSFNNLLNIPWNYPNNISCTINPIISLFIYFTSVCLVAVLSLERCLLIVYKKEYSDRFYYLIIIFLAITIFAICALTSALNGWGLVATGVYCLFDVSKVGGIVGSLLSGVLIGSCLIVIFIAYIKICLFRRDRSQVEQVELGLDPEKVKMEANSTIIKSLAIIIISAFTNGPFTLLLMMQIIGSNLNTPAINSISSILINFNLLTNALILLNMKPELWKGIKSFYGLKIDE
ncbi:hypothetical protein CONCODRAFT_10353 [Conidiobolus coronatus NRRL 28638]|uniref:G-protein coupled receptors family 1 profile domain-containing protein n=1 Tax=Conidiobolus coronatus (strain ATCC 28846 / CBS 209.66 / NRRL 28638) TaxID=796925 RepID=A0A137NXX1_CONC2|nr:hypothetical protein CONCODRAFT_10353 [Conidiobolus coronatus NRRL 28638]|eukprot:KXN67552.1 hypothetical protein CONCODRAFT_10353 [Conidiobolus coronatus NRRL 28638]